jgi:signal transduction histidine kinase
MGSGIPVYREGGNRRMKRFFQTFYGKISAIFLIFLLILGVAQIYITLKSSTKFMQEADQKLNTDLAKNMAAELTPLVKDSLLIENIQNEIHYMMVFNPKIEIYILDDKGKILAFFADPPQKVKRTSVNLTPIQTYLTKSSHELILGEDPRQPDRSKPFSVARLSIGKDINGFVYIILGGEQYDNAINLIRESFIVQTSLKFFFLIFSLVGFFGLILFFFLTRRLKVMTKVVKGFEEGNLDIRIQTRSKDELDWLAHTFNTMADTIVSNIETLKRSDQLRRELVANISHDLRSPLASIQGYLETISMKNLNIYQGEGKAYFDIILRNTVSLGRLIEDLFELSKLDACQIQPKLEPFSLPELIQDVVLKFRTQAEKAGIKLETVFPQSALFVMADIGLIERALSNLIENALRFTPPNGRVEVKIELKDEKKLQVIISDTGFGIPQEELPYIFERFYRVEKSRSREKGGTGLGLSIANKIINLHKSIINVESKKNVGTKFYFDLNIFNFSAA